MSTLRLSVRTNCALRRLRMRLNARVTLAEGVANQSSETSVVRHYGHFCQRWINESPIFRFESRVSGPSNWTTLAHYWRTWNILLLVADMSNAVARVFGGPVLAISLITATVCATDLWYVSDFRWVHCHSFHPWSINTCPSLSRKFSLSPGTTTVRVERESESRISVALDHYM